MSEETGAEYWADTHQSRSFAKRRRLARTIGLGDEIKQLCERLAIERRVLNSGLHWQFSKGPVILNFYPTTNKYTFQGTKSMGKHGNSLPNGYRFTFNDPHFAHRKPILLVALKELGGIRFKKSNGFGMPPVELGA